MMRKARISKGFLTCLLLSISLSWHIDLSSQTIVKSPKRENIEWLDVWIPNVNKTGLPRVLLIGNSITRQYYPEVAEHLSGEAYVGRLSTSKSLGDPALLQEVSLVLGYGDFDVVHVNNGMHGWDYTEEEYSGALPDLYNLIKECAPSAKVIWATTTPIRRKNGKDGFEPRNERVKERNKIMIEFLKDKNVLINDLYSIAVRDSSFYSPKDGIHPNSQGVCALANEVVRKLKNAIRNMN